MRERIINYAASVIVVLIWRLVAWPISLLPIGLSMDQCFMLIVAFSFALTLAKDTKNAPTPSISE